MDHSESELNRRIVAILFSDVVGYSKLNEPQLRTFFGKVLPEVAGIIDLHRRAFVELNTWGDGMVVVSDDPYDLAKLAFSLRDYYRDKEWSSLHLPDTLSCRLALHSGAIYAGHDPIRKLNGIVGSEVNLAARVEPITAPGEVWVTEDFKFLIKSPRDHKIDFDDLGERALAKQFGMRRVFRMRRLWEAPSVQASEPGLDDHEKIDILGIGALNLDYIATSSRLRRLDPELIADLATKFELGTEQPVTESEINYTLTKMGTGVFEACLGGSSFNVIHAIACTSPNLSLGYIGVAGKTNVAGHNFLGRLRNLSIDTSFVLDRRDQRSGVCISYIEEGERSLLTWPGANSIMAQFLQEERPKILSYLRKVKLVHITSFFDDSTPSVLADLLVQAKQENPCLTISFDPGHDWATKKPAGIMAILKIADYIFLNNREFYALGRHRPGAKEDKDFDTVREIFTACSESSVLIVLKRYDVITVFYNLHGRVMALEYPNKVLSQDVIEDATGAGDVFAAGFLVSRFFIGMELRHGVELGLRMVRAKLKAAGSKGFNSFGTIFETYAEEICKGSGACSPLDYGNDLGADKGVGSQD